MNYNWKPQREMMGATYKNKMRTFKGFFVKIKFKSARCWELGDFWSVLCFLVFLCCVSSVECNRPPRFLIDGQTEIVLRLKEGEETPVGSVIYKLRGLDPDGDALQFGVRTQTGSDVIRVENISPNEANIYLNKELDREDRDEYALVLTLTDGKLGHNNFITQSLLLLVEDVNDNVPIFKSFQPTVYLREDATPGVIAALEATDNDEGPYGQVVYHLQELEPDEKDLFSLTTSGGKAVVKLIGHLDYEKKNVHQLKVLAVDRAKQGRINTGVAALLVKVEDVEDQPPEFVRVSPVAKVAENSPIGTSVLQVIAIDGDRGINNPISYSLSSNIITGVLDLFTIDQTTGVVKTKAVLDRESMSETSGTFVLQVIATERGSEIVPSPWASTEVTIIVTDVNDETPMFRSKHYDCEVAENSPVNTPLTFLKSSIPEVFDYDQGLNGTFQLYVKGAGDMFDISPTKAINEATFMIKVKNSSALDYERVKMVNFTLVAKEVVKNNPKFTEVTVYVHILDRNDNYPEFIRSFYDVSVPENCDIGTTIAWVQALDDDSGNYGTKGVRYTNLAGSIEHLLNLHPTSGVITVKTAGGPNWDREQVSRHYLTVEARDNLGRGNRNTVQLIINLEDVNDNPPLFIYNKYEARLFENKPNFEVPIKVEARDADLNGTKNSEIEYTLFGELYENFTINAHTGAIEPKYPLDFELLDGSSKENVRTLLLTIRAKDLGSPSLFSDVPLVVYVQDVNDNAPIFEYNFYNKTILENITEGTSLMKIRAWDGDGSYPNNHIVYRIQRGASDKFVIGAETGVISVAKGASLDPDITSPRTLEYKLTVIALDGAPGENRLEKSVTVIINVIDVNNKNPIFLESRKSKLKENVPVGTIVSKVVAKDLDTTARLFYSTNPNECEARNERGNLLLRTPDFDCAKMFHLNAKTGVLTVAKPLDREVAENFRISLNVEDLASETGPQIAKTFIDVELEDINDNSPKFVKPFYRFTITENSKNGVAIGSVLAEDADKNKTITYALEGKVEYKNLVFLDTSTGNLVVSNRIDHETYNWMNLSVKAIDSGVPPRSSRVELFIQVLDENDNSPIFMAEPTRLLLPEDMPVGTQVTVIEAQDADSGEYGKITYLLDRLSSQGKFSLDADTGILKISDKLDREEKASFLLIIEAWDNYQYGFNNGESRNAFKHINVTILDVNDNIPQLLVPPYCVNVTEFHEIGQPITTIHASDSDDPSTSNGQVIIDIADGNSLELFSVEQINEWSAELKAIAPLRGRHGNYTLLMRAQDLGTPSHLVEEPICISIIDFNDHAPVFVTPPPNSTLRVPENATVGSALIQIVATDADIGLNGAVRYKLKADPGGHWKTFNLQPVSGILELRLPLNRDKQKIYDIRIEAYDLGTPTPLSSDLDLTVYVSNINDYQPQFLSDEFTVSFTENREPGVEVQKLPDTVDRDDLEFEGPPTPICYYIIGGNEEELFELDKFQHTLTILKPLDREEQSAYLLLVKATEDCSATPRSDGFFDPNDDTQLKVIVNVTDVNDNPPHFLHRVFTGGVSTATDFGTRFMSVKAYDADIGRNAEIKYYLIGKIQMTLTEGLENIHKPPFVVDQDTGDVILNFDPQQGMKGYFDFMVMVNDTDNLRDMSRVFIYLLREDQRVRFVLRQHPPELREKIELFREILGNVTGAIVNIDEFRVHANHDGTVDKTRTDLYLHLVDKTDNSILEVEEVLRLVDQNTEKLDSLFKDFNVLDTQPGGVLALKSFQAVNTTFWLTASSMFLLLLLCLCLALCLNQRQRYHRKLKAATATAYVGADSEIHDRGLSIISGRVPNTNKHTLHGSNPIWLQAYENEWFKNGDLYSQASEHDSLDENVISNPESNLCSNEMEEKCNKRPQNVYQTLPAPHPRKLETTEL
ncbi:cadherin-23 [Coccinella septempunctata]|uniref:cadherin-23 n=1 Tax=Coccinella septempunctata TaxID=41139 RepID=UPI001D07E983|nr:cadherin-23 [Coccinella septempunctata]XP_044756939.1 cadherin-23 [Coccinella septempunctata]